MPLFLKNCSRSALAECLQLKAYASALQLDQRFEASSFGLAAASGLPIRGVALGGFVVVCSNTRDSGKLLSGLPQAILGIEPSD
ncbi:MAG: hypothetical protein F6K55_43910 [Moorea sp. SIO4A3]|nr:hypothetical protein [Moorena sp. SIO4A3]